MWQMLEGREWWSRGWGCYASLLSVWWTMEESSSCSKIIGTPTVINLHFERAATNIMREDNKETHSHILVLH